jgi:hypothetical protein
MWQIIELESLYDIPEVNMLTLVALSPNGPPKTLGFLRVAKPRRVSPVSHIKIPLDQWRSRCPIDLCVC